MITTIETVMRVAPARAEAAPTMAYVPGVIQGTSGSQEAKTIHLGCSRCQTSTMRPMTRPYSAPMVMDGSKMRLGGLGVWGRI